MGQRARSGKSPARLGTVTVLLIVAIIGTLWVPSMRAPCRSWVTSPSFTGTS